MKIRTFMPRTSLAPQISIYHSVANVTRISAYQSYDVWISMNVNWFQLSRRNTVLNMVHMIIMQCAIWATPHTKILHSLSLSIEYFDRDRLISTNEIHRHIRQSNDYRWWRMTRHAKCLNRRTNQQRIIENCNRNMLLLLLFCFDMSMLKKRTIH